MDIITGLIELLGMWLIGDKRKVGFLVMMVACVLWAYVAFDRHVYGLLIVVIPAFGLNIRNYKKWSK